ncbi:GNAT family N-acetyltransferase [Clostridium hydrogeniformans]|uniref:GNAT family N-acetyltransferase n=1 Tax=Clostridium hydrogeniformans TaxID=349933 RepID=UPI00048403A0|nr:GNAT family protein [Clostridium hydrogeniformans]
MYRGEKVLLRAYKSDDTEKAYEYVNDAELMRYLSPNVAFPMTYKEEKEWVEAQGQNKDGTYNFAIEDLESGRYIGGCGINEVNWLTRVVTVGIMIGDKDYWGRGYGTDTMNTLIKFIFSNMNVNKIKLYTFSFNERAQRCYEKCGFKVEGILKEEVFKDGQYYDEVIMSIFKNQWDQGDI